MGDAGTASISEAVTDSSGGCWRTRSSGSPLGNHRDVAMGAPSASVNFDLPIVNFGGGGKPSQLRRRSSITPWNFSSTPGAFIQRECTRPNQPSPPTAIQLAVEYPKAAIDNRRIRIRSECGSCEFEQDGERGYLMLVHLVVREE